MATEVEEYLSKPNGMVPNSRFPLLIYRDGIPNGGANNVRKRFRENGWLNNWQNQGIYQYGHYHSTTHECLGCAAGWMELELFCQGGKQLRIHSGDVILMPAGVSHEMVGKSDDLIMVGGYPDGRDWDNMRNDHLTEKAFFSAVKRIMMLPIPIQDPVNGSPIKQWLNAPSSTEAGLNELRDRLDDN